MVPKEPLSIIWELARAEQAGDPFAFRFVPQEYVLRGEGGVFRSAVFPWEPGLLTDLEALRLPRRDPAIVARVGETLRRFLDSAGFPEYERAIESAQQDQRPIVLTVRSAAAELYALPWELLTLRGSGQALGELTSLLLRYEWPSAGPPATINAVPTAQEGRLLFAWSAAGGAVPAAEQLSAIAAACQQGGVSFDVTTNVVANASCGRLAAALESARKSGDPIAVLQLLCHGGAAGSSFGLVLDREDAADENGVVDAARLRQLLAPYAKTLRLVVLCACDSGNPGVLGNQLGSVAQTLHRVGIPSVIASRFPLSVSGSIRLTEVLYHQLLAETQSLEASLLAVRRRLAEDPSQIDWANLQLYARAADGDDTRPLSFRPYRGLLSFQPEHQRFLFGRDAEIKEIVTELSTLILTGKPRLLIVAGASGTGKSSLLLAGAVPKLLLDPSARFRFVRMRPGSQPLATLEAALTLDPGADSRPVLLVVDQLEEIFTHVTSPAQRQAFARRLWSLATDQQSPAQISILLTLRVDFIGRCGELSLDDAGLCLDRIAYDEAHRVFVSKLDRAQLRAVITEPATLVGLQLEDGLTNRMLQELGEEPGALPLLEDTLDLLWQRRTGRTLTQRAYDEIGGVTGALTGRADALVDALPEPEQRTAQRLLVRLVDPNLPSLGQDYSAAARRRVHLESLRSGTPEELARLDRVLAQFVEARLLFTTREGDQQLVEVAHEALIRKWTRLHAWLRADQARLAALEEFAVWTKRWRDYGTLLVHEELSHAERLLSHCEADLENDTRTLLRDSRTRASGSTLFSRGVLALGAFLLISFFLGMVLLSYSSDGTARSDVGTMLLFGALFGVLLPAVSIVYFLVVLIRVLLQAWRRFKTTKRNKSPKK